MKYANTQPPVTDLKVLTVLMLLLVLAVSACEKKPVEESAVPTIFHVQGEMTGELSRNGAILQSRLTAADTLASGDLPGVPGVACFDISTEPDFPHYLRTGWMRAAPENDYIVKVKVDRLRPGVRYYYRLVYGPDEENTENGETRTFRTLPDSTVTEPVSFVVVTGMNYHFFHHGKPDRPETAYQGDDKNLGYPALESIAMMKPDFFVGTGDNVYYDHPVGTRAKTIPEMRKKWHQQFLQPRYVKLFSEVPVYWEKDDHDHRYNDSDTSDIGGGPKPDGAAFPSNADGIRIFLEQVPVADPLGETIRTYRTVRINRDLQLWFTEGRDYRSDNSMPDGPDKTLWGTEQLSWLKETLLASDASFKLLISPTPMVGPDDAYKTDNHVNHNGFRHEGDEFFAWLKKNGFLGKNFYIICGDRHWQYHSVHPSGFEEFSCGALVDANSRLGRKPGDPESTDPDALIKQPYMQKESSGGFLRVSLAPGEAKDPSLEFAFYDEKGNQLYKTEKSAD